MYFFSFLLLLGAELLYFRLARNFQIVDIPNNRSSHTKPVIRGGGIVFFIAAILFLVTTDFSYPFFMGAVLLAGTVSFMDDIQSLPTWTRFTFHFLAALLVLLECHLLFEVPIAFSMLLSIMLVAIFNVYNFMDGINGMNGLYSLAVIIPLLLSEKNIPLQSLEIYIVLALIVFLFFNCRRTAVCFSGDVGSITLSVMLSFLILRRIVNTENLAYIGLLLIYGIDASFTILRRLLKGENIFRAHRTHLYQFLCNELKIPHVQVSEAYALLQFIIGLGIVYNFVDLSGLIIIAAILSLIYLFLKKRILSTISSNGPLKPTELP